MCNKIVITSREEDPVDNNRTELLELFQRFRITRVENEHMKLKCLICN